MKPVKYIVVIIEPTDSLALTRACTTADTVVTKFGSNI